MYYKQLHCCYYRETCVAVCVYLGWHLHVCVSQASQCLLVCLCGMSALATWKAPNRTKWTYATRCGSLVDNQLAKTYTKYTFLFGVQQCLSLFCIVALVTSHPCRPYGSTVIIRKEARKCTCRGFSVRSVRLMALPTLSDAYVNFDVSSRLVRMHVCMCGNSNDVTLWGITCNRVWMRGSRHWGQLIL